jgi:RNA polymerase sigma-B factor
MASPENCLHDTLEIEQRVSGDDHRFVVHGQLDLASAPLLRAALEDALTGPATTLTVDVTGVDFLDCTAVGMLLEIRRQADHHHHTLRVTGATGLPLEILEIAGVAKRLGLYDTPEPTPPTDGLPAAGQLVLSMLDTMSQLTPGTPEHHHLRDRVITTCSPFATALARRFAHRGEPFDDLNQVAMIGLLKAVDGYNPHRGREFIAYAKPTILGELRRHFRDRTWAMTVPRRHKEMRLALNTAREDLTQQLGRSPSVTELAEHLNATTEDVLQAIEASHAYQSVSLSTPVGDEDGITLADLLGTTDPDLDAVENRAAIPTLIAQLPEREQRILTMRFYGNMTQSQIAEWTGVSQMHVSRLLKAALTRLREQLLQEA